MTKQQLWESIDKLQVKAAEHYAKHIEALAVENANTKKITNDYYEGRMAIDAELSVLLEKVMALGYDEE